MRIFREGFAIHLPDGKWISHSARLGHKYGSIYEVQVDFESDPESPTQYPYLIPSEIEPIIDLDRKCTITVNGVPIFHGPASLVRFIQGRYFPDVWHCFI